MGQRPSRHINSYVDECTWSTIVVSESDKFAQRCTILLQPQRTLLEKKSDFKYPRSQIPAKFEELEEIMVRRKSNSWLAKLQIDGDSVGALNRYSR